MLPEDELQHSDPHQDGDSHMQRHGSFEVASNIALRQMLLRCLWSQALSVKWPGQKLTS